MNLVFIILSLIVLLAIEILYFKIADRFNIIDQPNHRSSHHAVTIRGGGVIFTVAALLFFLFDGFEYPLFIIGLLMISLVSFLDDIMTLNNKLRLSVHLIAVLLLFYQWNLFDFEWYWIIIGGVFVIGTINAYNFMDGINGITGAYSLLTILTLYYINSEIVAFTSPDFLIIIGISLLVFNFFNFRKKAKCFAGDVGSVSMAFILIFLIGELILKTHNFAYILLLLCYGLDTAFTIFFRKMRKENIFKAHRSHFYQFLANEKGIPHLWVSALYFVVQLLINLLLIYWVKDSLYLALLLMIIAAFIFIGLRFILEGKKKLLLQDLVNNK